MVFRHGNKGLPMELSTLLDRPASLIGTEPANLRPQLRTDSDYVRGIRERGRLTCFADVVPVSTDPLRFSVGLDNVCLAGSGREVEGYRAVYRTDTGVGLGVVGDRYVPIQPSETADFVDELARQTGGKVAKVSVLGGGRDIGARIMLPKEIAEPDGRSLNICALSVQSSNDGTSTWSVSAFVYRPHCRNAYHALAAADTGRGRHLAHNVARVAIRHTRAGAERVKLAHQVIDSLRPSFDRFSDDFARLMAKSVDDELRGRFLDAVLPLPDRGNESGAELDKLLKRERRVKEQRREVLRITRDMEDPSILWGLLQGATRWAQHDRTVKGASTNPDARAYSNLPGGSAYEFSVSAQAAALALV